MTHHNGKDRNGKATAPPIAVARNMSQIAHDVVELAELQTALVKLELNGWWKQLVLPAALLIASVVLAVSCLPVLILSAAYGLAAGTSLALGWCLLIAGAATLIVAALIGFFGWKRLQAAQAPLTESRREFSQNVRWVKNVLKQGARPRTALHELHSPN